MIETLFVYHPAVKARFPQTVGGIVLASGLVNRPSPPELIRQYEQEQALVRSQIGESLSEIPAIAAWRACFRQFGTDPTKYRSAPEALLRRVSKKGDIPSINALVDMGNLVSIRYALAVAVIDLQAVRGKITVQLATGTEAYRELNQEAVMHPDEGEVIFLDEANIVMARRWCWRQSDESAAKSTTTNALIAIEAQHEGGEEEVRNAVADLSELIKTHLGGTVETDILTMK